MGGLKNRERTAPREVIDVKMSIGRGADLTATSGARIVAILAKKLQNPIAVAQNKVGKISTVQTYTITKPAEIPNFAKMIKKGINPGCAAPHIKIQIPPTTEIM